MTDVTNPAVYKPAFEPVVGIWDSEEHKIFGRYQITIKMADIVRGGIPQNPEIIESWLRNRIAGGDEEFRIEMLRTLDSLGHDVSEGMTMDQLKDVAKDMAAKNNANTFFRDEHGLWIRAANVKAMLKENVAILYPYTSKENRMGPTAKAAKAFWAERVFVDHQRVYLMRDGQHITEPDGTELQIGHVSGAQGQRSTLTYYDYCAQPELTFTCYSLQDMVEVDMWRNVFLAAQRNGLGATRSLGHGQFKVLAFDKLRP